MVNGGGEEEESRDKIQVIHTSPLLSSLAREMESDVRPIRD
jgi:hypothetical protein